MLVELIYLELIILSNPQVLHLCNDLSIHPSISIYLSIHQIISLHHMRFLSYHSFIHIITTPTSLFDFIIKLFCRWFLDPSHHSSCLLEAHAPQAAVSGVRWVDQQGHELAIPELRHAVFLSHHSHCSSTISLLHGNTSPAIILIYRISATYSTVIATYL